MNSIHASTYQTRNLLPRRTRKLLHPPLSRHHSVHAMGLTPIFNQLLDNVLRQDSTLLRRQGNAACLFTLETLTLNEHLHSHPVPPASVQIMSNPNRARGGHVNGRGHPSIPANQVVANGYGRPGHPSSPANHVNGRGRGHTGPLSQANAHNHHAENQASAEVVVEPVPAITQGPFRGRGRGRGRGGFVNGFVARGGPRGAMRGRGRGSFSPVVS